MGKPTYRFHATKVDRIAIVNRPAVPDAEILIFKSADKAVAGRGDCVFASDSNMVKDMKDHFPINDMAQARNALARVMQYTACPAWYKGTLKELQDKVQAAVAEKYPSMDVSKGGRGSGNFGHAGRVGERGGSAEGGGMGSGTRVRQDRLWDEAIRLRDLNSPNLDGSTRDNPSGKPKEVVGGADKPKPNTVYSLVDVAGKPSIAAGNTLEESMVGGVGGSGRPVDEAGKPLDISPEIPKERWGAYGHADLERSAKMGEIKVGMKTTSGTIERHATTKGGKYQMVQLDVGMKDTRDIIALTGGRQDHNYVNHPKADIGKEWDRIIKDSKQYSNINYIEKALIAERAAGIDGMATELLESAIELREKGMEYGAIVAEITKGSEWFEKEYKGNEFDLSQDLQNALQPEDSPALISKCGCAMQCEAPTVSGMFLGGAIAGSPDISPDAQFTRGFALGSTEVAVGTLQGMFWSYLYSDNSAQITSDAWAQAFATFKITMLGIIESIPSTAQKQAGAANNGPSIEDSINAFERELTTRAISEGFNIFKSAVWSIVFSADVMPDASERFVMLADAFEQFVNNGLDTLDTLDVEVKMQLCKIGRKISEDRLLRLKDAASVILGIINEAAIKKEGEEAMNEKMLKDAIDSAIAPFQKAFDGVVALLQEKGIMEKPLTDAEKAAKVEAEKVAKEASEKKAKEEVEAAEKKAKEEAEAKEKSQKDLQAKFDEQTAEIASMKAKLEVVDKALSTFEKRTGLKVSLDVAEKGDKTEAKPNGDPFSDALKAASKKKAA